MGKKKVVLGIGILLSIYSMSFSQEIDFKDGDRVCFVGNSITMSGGFHHHIALAYALRYPQRRIQFFNCGISGDVTGGMLKRMQNDILIHKPSWCVVMAGMNDVNGSLYTKDFSGNMNVQKMRKDALTLYNKNMEALITAFLDAHVKVILQKPTIFDQTAKIGGDPSMGRNEALGVCAAYVEQLAAKYSLPVVDYYTAMLTINTALQLKDSTATIISKDRIHPGDYGHLIMAHEFLKTDGFGAVVAAIDINMKPLKANCKNGKITSIKTTQDGIVFSVLENALPVPELWAGFKPDSLTNFTAEFNQETIVIKGLKKAMYNLKIDGIPIGTYTTKQLRDGINIATLPTTPQNKQAANVQQAYRKYWETESLLRTIKLVEYNQLRNMVDKSDMDLVRKEFEKIIDGFKKDPKPYADFYKKSFDSYLVHKPVETKYIESLKLMYETICQLNQPTEHEFVVEKI